MAFQQDNLQASTHFRKARMLDPLDEPNYYRHGNPFGAVGDGRPIPSSPLSVPKVDTGKPAQPYTRFDWGIDWKGFNADAETKKGKADREGKAIPRLSLLSNGREDAGSVAETESQSTGMSGAELDWCSVYKRLIDRGEGAVQVLDERGMRSVESAGGDSGYVRSEEESSGGFSSDCEDAGLEYVVDHEEEGEFLDLEDWLDLVIHLTFECVKEARV